MATTKKIKTKDKILLFAVKMFNEQGVQSITSRHIAVEMGISHGNLDYHYKTKEDLLLAIYKQMRKEMSDSYLSRNTYSTALEHFHHLLIQLEAFQLKYRFFNLDVLEISRSFPKISKLLTKTLELRKQQMDDLFQEFIKEGYLKEKKDFDHGRLQHTIRIIITFWLSQQVVLHNFKYTENGEMTKHIWEILLPYLTESGHKEYDRLIIRFGYFLNR
ncbi:MAG TPA: TetR/AcrR family transcriptional regulator [Arenibacter sp.]|nr:TetR/AcrR family transcriptional regulator [Arenibacter sp.]